MSSSRTAGPPHPTRGRRSPTLGGRSSEERELHRPGTLPLAIAGQNEIDLFLEARASHFVPIARLIDEKIKESLVDERLLSQLESGGIVRVDVKDGELPFEFTTEAPNYKSRSPHTVPVSGRPVGPSRDTSLG